MANLHDDILSNIFIRLPAKQLAQMRSLSKHWNTFLSQPSFIKSHLDRSIMAAEVTMICVDNSGSLSEDLVMAQTKAIRFYCNQKLKAHPENLVGIVATGSQCFLCRPDRDIKKIMYLLNGLLTSGPLYLPIPLRWCLGFFRSTTNITKRRLVMFIGSELTMSRVLLEECAALIKKFNAALDVVNFNIENPKETRQCLEEFVASVNHNGNSRYFYAPARSRKSLTKQLKRSSIMPRVEPRVKGETDREPHGMKKDHHELAVPEELS